MAQRDWRNKKIDGKFTATLILDEFMMRQNADLDNKVKAPIDLCKHLNLIVDDSITYMRELHVLLGDDEQAPNGARLILRSL